jgi:MoaA/NifB/PqqE/SkfB family radical SAM enzyme
MQLEPEAKKSRPLASVIRLERVTRANCETWGILDGSVLPPRQLEIQPTSQCHRVCSFCSHIRRNQRGGELQPSIVASILREAQQLGTEVVNFSGGGEPLIWDSGDLAEAMAQAHGFAQVSLTTSGDQLWDDQRGSLSDLCLRVIRNCHDLLLNIPGTDDESLKRQVSGGPSWMRTRRLLESLLTFAANTSKPRIHCVVVITQDNVRKLAEIDQRFTDLGIESIYYKPFKVYEDRTPSRRVERDAILRALAKQLPSFGPSAGLSRLVANFTQGAPSPSPCWVNRLGFSLIIDPLGNGYLCTPTVGDKRYAIGNVYEGGLTGLWLGAVRFNAMHELSERSLRGGCPSDCRYHSHNSLIGSAVSGNAACLPAHTCSNAGLDDNLIGVEPRL